MKHSSTSKILGQNISGTYTVKQIKYKNLIQIYSNFFGRIKNYYIRRNMNQLNVKNHDMEYTWETCFNFAYFYTRFSFLPPFWNPSLLPLGYFMILIVFILLLRALYMPFQVDKTNTEYYLVILKFSFLIIKAMIYIATKNTSQKVLKETVNLFLEKNKINIITGKHQQFIQIWQKNKALIFLKWFYRVEIFMSAVWIGQAAFFSAVDYDDATKSKFPYSSPYYNYSVVTRWLYIVFDVLGLWVCVFQNMHNDIVLISLFSFLRSQMDYLKLLIEDLFDERRYGDIDRNIKWWISNHQDVLR